MRVEAKQLADYNLWRVWHCPQCRYLSEVVWADDDKNQYGEFLYEPGFPVVTVQVQRIVIIPESKIIYIDPPLSLRDLVTEEQEALCQSSQ